MKPYLKDARDGSDSNQARRETFAFPACNCETQWNDNHLESCGQFNNMSHKEMKRLVDGRE